VGGDPVEVFDDGAIYCETHLIVAKDVSKAEYEKVLLRCSTLVVVCWGNGWKS
jgi:hypothetical protein